MLMADKMMELLARKENVDSLVENLITTSEDFAEDHKLFEEAIEYFKSALSEDVSPSADDLCDAIRRQIMSQMIFAGYLGFQANVDHFLNPVARTFIDVDPETYLRESVARALPEYVSAQAIVDSFWKQLPPELNELFEQVIAYTAHFETLVPKIAHYNGFLLGNELLPFVIPGYQIDVQLTVQYCNIIRKLLQQH